MHKIARVLASEILREHEPPSDSLDEARALIDAIYTGTRLEAAWSVRSLKQTQRQTLLTAQIAMTIEDAAIAHEIGHVLMWRGRERDVFEQIEKGLAEEKQLSNQQRRDWAVEHFADLTAARLLPRPGISVEFAGIHGLAILFLILTTIERRILRRSGWRCLHRWPDYPPASDRLAFVTGFNPEIIRSSVVKLCAAICGKIGA